MQKEENFKDLQKKWNKILEKEGLSENRAIQKELKMSYKHRKSNKKQYTPEQTAKHYQQAELFVDIYHFVNKLDKEIYKLYAKGLSSRKIEKELKKTIFNCSKTTIQRKVKYINKIKNLVFGLIERAEPQFHSEGVDFLNHLGKPTSLTWEQIEEYKKYYTQNSGQYE